jgi:uncharacterized protein YeaO (DUF488 family)
LADPASILTEHEEDVRLAEFARPKSDPQGSDQCSTQFSRSHKRFENFKNKYHDQLMRGRWHCQHLDVAVGKFNKIIGV